MTTTAAVQSNDCSQPGHPQSVTANLQRGDDDDDNDDYDDDDDK